MRNITKHIALTLKHLRQERGWSLDKTAEKTGVSKAMLGQIEREESSPTIATLWKIATGFQTSFSLFLTEAEQNKHKPLLRDEPAHDFSSEKTKILVVPIFPFDREMGFEVFGLTLFPGYEHLSTAHEKGVIEHVIALDDGLQVLIGRKWKTLKKGQGLRFPADKPHGYRNGTNDGISFHNIIYYPRTK